MSRYHIVNSLISFFRGLNNRVFYTLLSFGMLYSLISLVNHYLLRTYALDLGLYTNAVYKYSRFILADSGMISARHDLMLGGHFDLYLVLFAPLVYLFGTWTLLLIQIAALLTGAYGVYRYILLYSAGNRNTAWFAMLFFLMFFGVLSAVAFDYHSVVVASSAVPWFFYLFRQKRFYLSSLLLLFILISQEDVSLFMVFVCLGLMFESGGCWLSKRWQGGFALFSAAWFLFLFYVLNPAISPPEQASSFSYSVLGKNPGEAIGFLFTHPCKSLQILFINHLGIPYCDGIKREFLIVLLFSGLWMLVRKPWFLLMMIPLLFQKFFHDMCVTWGTGKQYSVEFAPIMAIGVFSVISGFRKRFVATVFSIILLLSSLLTTLWVIDETNSAESKVNSCFYCSAHYKRDFDVAQVKSQLRAIIPKDAAVSAQSLLVPHMALRPQIYQFPVIKKAPYVVLLPNESPYPMRREEYDDLLYKFRFGGHWITIYDDGNLVIFKRLKPV